MTKETMLRVAVSVSLFASLLVLTLPTSRASAQTIQERGLKVKVGATVAEMNSGRAQNVQLWAVLIGISRYKNGDQNIGGYQIQNLKSAADDAQAIHNFLRSEEGGSFPADHIILLKDESATKAEVEKALARLKETKPDDFFITFIAAHGVLAPRFDTKLGRTVEIPYFVMYDTDPRDMANTALPMKAFEDSVRATPAKKGLVLTDTCHSAGVIMAGRGGEATTRANSLLTEELKKNDASGVGYIWAADQTEVSLEKSDLNLGQGSGHGVFTYCLLEGLRGNADVNPPDGLVTYVELKNYVRDKVPEMTDNSQHPGGTTTSIETNGIPVSAVPSSCKDPANCGSLVIRAPEMDGVNVAIDDSPAGTVNSNVEITRRVPAGDRTLSFTVGNMKRQRFTRVVSGKSKFIEVNLAFSQSDEDALIPPPDSTVSVYFAEEKVPSKDAKEAFLDGVDAFNRQEMDAAIQKFNEAIKKNNAPYADALVYKGRAEQSLGRKADAVTSFQQALAVRKSDYETEALLAEARFNLHLDPAEVEPTLKSIIRRHPDWDYPHVVLGDILFFRKDFIGAERELAKAIRVNPKSAPAHLILADVLTYQDSKEKRERAVREAQQALELFNAISKKKVSAARSLKGLSVSHLIFGGGRFKNNTAMAEAHHMVAKTIARKAQFMLYQDDAATLPQGELDQALSAINAAKELAKNDKTRLALVRETNALIYFLKEDPTRAIEEGEAALKMMELPETHLTLTQAYVSNQRFAPAVDHLTRYIALSRTQMSSDDLKKYQEELTRLTKMRDANRQKK
jgi:uncharacterized caspase-like protein/tetratricopeptide (TPR) repeat protein